MRLPVLVVDDGGAVALEVYEGFPAPGLKGYLRELREGRTHEG